MCDREAAVPSFRGFTVSHINGIKSPGPLSCDVMDLVFDEN